jgi:uncharacterized protein DUF1707
MSTFRASDEDRQFVAESLRGDLLSGRLSVEEYEDRVARVYRSTTYAELDAIVADLPWEPSSVPAPRRRRPLFGRRPFSVRIDSPEQPAVVIAEAMRTIGPHLLRAGYSMERPAENQLVFTGSGGRSGRSSSRSSSFRSASSRSSTRRAERRCS